MSLRMEAMMPMKMPNTTITMRETRMMSFAGGLGVEVGAVEVVGEEGGDGDELRGAGGGDGHEEHDGDPDGAALSEQEIGDGGGTRPAPASDAVMGRLSARAARPREVARVKGMENHMKPPRR